MVGSPKHLSDLDKIEADERITCRRCGSEDDWTTADIARHLFEIGGSTIWSEIRRYMTCRRFGCGSSELWALAVPFARRPANMRRRVGAVDARTIPSSPLSREAGRIHATAAASALIRATAVAWSLPATPTRPLSRAKESHFEMAENVSFCMSFNRRRSVRGGSFR